MNNFFCNHKTQKSDPEHTFSEIDINYRRDYSKGKSFKVSIWNEIDTYNNDDFIQDFVIYNQSLWARIDSTPSTNEVPTEGPWTKVMDGVSDVQFKEEGNKIFWKYEDESEWKDLFELDVVSESEIRNMLKDIATDVDSNFYDKTLSETSINAVQNKVITQALNKKVDKTELSKKQDVISDLSEIRNKANSALQSVPSEYVTESELANKGYLTEHQDISGKQDKIVDLAQIRTNAQKGATALQTVPSEYATKTDVSNEVAKIVNSAPKAFDTLKEIADWIEEDAEPAIVLANKVEQKVDKVEGLGLSEENYTTEEKEKLSGLENYDDSEIKVDLANKAEKSEIPTKMSQLEQDVEIGGTPDWSASEGEAGYIKNRTHYPCGNPREENTYEERGLAWRDIREINPFGYNYYKVTINGESHIIDFVGKDWPQYDFEKDEQNKFEYDLEFNNNVGLKLSFFKNGGGESIIVIEYYPTYSNAPETIDVSITDYYVDFKQLDEKFIPNTIARKSELTELSAEVSGLSERIDNLPTAESSVFEVEYGVTTYEEIVAANNAGKIVLCRKSTQIARLTSVTASLAYFVATYSAYSYQYICMASGVWYEQRIDLTHKIESLDDDKVKITISGKSAEVATPQYVENLLGTIINGDY